MSMARIARVDRSKLVMLPPDGIENRSHLWACRRRTIWENGGFSCQRTPYVTLLFQLQHPDVAAGRLEAVEDDESPIGRPAGVIDAHIGIRECEQLLRGTARERCNPKCLV